MRLMLWRILLKVEPYLIRLYRRVSQPPIPNLKGDRDVEYSWIVANLPEGSGKALDFELGRAGVGWVL